MHYYLIQNIPAGQLIFFFFCMKARYLKVVFRFHMNLCRLICEINLL